MAVKDKCCSERVKQRACILCVSVCVFEIVYICLRVVTLMQRREPGEVQPLASGKGRHDEVMLTACNLQSVIF